MFPEHMAASSWAESVKDVRKALNEQRRRMQTLARVIQDEAMASTLYKQLASLASIEHHEFFVDQEFIEGPPAPKPDYRLGLICKPKYRTHDLYYERGRVVECHPDGHGGLSDPNGVLKIRMDNGREILACADEWQTASIVVHEESESGIQRGVVFFVSKHGGNNYVSSRYIGIGEAAEVTASIANFRDGSAIVPSATDLLWVEFDANVGSSIEAATDSMVLTNNTNSNTYDIEFVSYDAGTNQALFNFPAQTNGWLPDGQYQLDIPAYTLVVNGLLYAEPITLYFDIGGPFGRPSASPPRVIAFKREQSSRLIEKINLFNDAASIL